MRGDPPIAASPVTGPQLVAADRLLVTDESLVTKWRLYGDPPVRVRPGTSRRNGAQLVWSVAPSEWTVVGPRPEGNEVVDLTHVRAMLRLTGQDAPQVLSHLCALDLGDDLFPPTAVARTLVAGVATEIVRDDTGEARSYLLLPSRSFGRFIADVIVDAAEALPP